MRPRLTNFASWSENILRYNGPLVLLWRMLQKGVHPYGRLEVVTFFQRDLIQPLKEPKARPGLTLTLAGVSDIEPLVTLMKERQKIPKDTEVRKIEALILSRFQRGGLCFLGKIGEEIIHYNWTSFNWEESLGGRFVHLQPDEAFCLDAFTPRKWRGQGIYPAAHFKMLQRLQSKGYRKAYTLIDTDNKSSRKVHLRQGWKPFATVICFTPKGSSPIWIWRLKGNLDRFLEKEKPREASPL